MLEDFDDIDDTDLQDIRKLITEEQQKKGRKSTPCESCFYFEDDECTLDLDEDELYKFEMRSSYGADILCPYYKFYDEYKSVQKQN